MTMTKPNKTVSHNMYTLSALNVLHIKCFHVMFNSSV